jgi:NAD-dependent dihydropyrimidine dehydrogenase PreA subunit
MGRMIYLKDVVTLGLNEEKCLGCGMCTLVCPRGVLNLNNGKALIRDRDACIECGACAMNCPAEAITVQRGVGCAAAVINSALGRNRASCCCVIEASESSGDEGVCPGGGRSSCC